ncbi:hypothetical protein D5086_003546 [Populus alba]|uniref:Uncharacterized protein n=1 Tax=Populus alba TaxID=43335 RepID=A0ACC4D4K3_POPAL
MVPKNLEFAREDFWTRSNSSGAFSHAPPPLAARGFTRRRTNPAAWGGWIDSPFSVSQRRRRRWSCGCRRCGPGVDEGTRPVLGEEEDAAAGWVGRERRRGPLWPATAGAAVEVGEEMSRCGGGLLCRWVVVVAVDG